MVAQAERRTCYGKIVPPSPINRMMLRPSWPTTALIAPVDASKTVSEVGMLPAFGGAFDPERAGERLLGRVGGRLRVAEDRIGDAIDVVGVVSMG